MGADIGLLITPAVLITVAALTLTVATGLGARVGLFLEDLTPVGTERHELDGPASATAHRPTPSSPRVQYLCHQKGARP
jgi:hypothetical protein